MQVETPAQSRFIANLSEQWLWKPAGLAIQGTLYLLLGVALWQQFRSNGLAIGFGGYFMAAILLLFGGILIRVVLYRVRERQRSLG